VKPDIPILVNLRLDPFERTDFTGSVEFFQWFKYEFWRFVYVQQEVGKLAQTAIEFPPMQKARASISKPSRSRPEGRPDPPGSDVSRYPRARRALGFACWAGNPRGTEARATDWTRSTRFR